MFSWCEFKRGAPTQSVPKPNSRAIFDN